jgi:hypothetical protein
MGGSRCLPDEVAGPGQTACKSVYKIIETGRYINEMELKPMF